MVFTTRKITLDKHRRVVAPLVLVILSVWVKRSVSLLPTLTLKTRPLPETKSPPIRPLTTGFLKLTQHLPYFAPRSGVQARYRLGNRKSTRFPDTLIDGAALSVKAFCFPATHINRHLRSICFPRVAKQQVLGRPCGGQMSLVSTVRNLMAAIDKLKCPLCLPITRHPKLVFRLPQRTPSRPQTRLYPLVNT